MNGPVVACLERGFRREGETARFMLVEERGRNTHNGKSPLFANGLEEVVDRTGRKDTYISVSVSHVRTNAAANRTRRTRDQATNFRRRSAREKGAKDILVLVARIKRRALREKREKKGGVKEGTCAQGGTMHDSRHGQAIQTRGSQRETHCREFTAAAC